MSVGQGRKHASEACKRRVLEKASAGPCDRATALQCSRVVRVSGRWAWGSSASVYVATLTP